MRRRSGFTLIEVLVAAGIIVVLATILIPVISKMRNTTRQTLCLNNMRQIGSAILSYARANNDAFPRPAGATWSPEDWIYWGEPTKDPNQGRIIEYLGGRFDATLFTCPNDDPDTHGNSTKGAAYPYSYSVNDEICTPGSLPTLAQPQIVNPTRKVLLIDENAQTINDAEWTPRQPLPANQKVSDPNFLSFRHDRKNVTANDANAGMGNVVFCDGHSELIDRATLADPASRIWDPKFRP